MLYQQNEIIGKIDGRLMYLPKGEDVTKALQEGGYERRETEYVLNYVRKGDSAIDVGANIGYYTLLLASLVGKNGFVQCWEANPSTCSILQRNAIVNGYTTTCVVPMVASDTEGECTFFNTGGTSQNRTWIGKEKDVSFYKVKKNTIDNLFPPHLKLNFLKIDVEGSEVFVLKGAINTIRRQESMAMLIEYCPSHLLGAGATREEFIQLMYGFGFRVYGIGNQSLVHISPDNLFQMIKPYEEGRLINLWCVK